MSIEAEAGLRVLAINILGRFLLNRYLRSTSSHVSIQLNCGM